MDWKCEETNKQTVMFSCCQHVIKRYAFHRRRIINFIVCIIWNRLSFLSSISCSIYLAPSLVPLKSLHHTTQHNMCCYLNNNKYNGINCDGTMRIYATGDLLPTSWSDPPIHMLCFINFTFEEFNLQFCL